MGRFSIHADPKSKHIAYEKQGLRITLLTSRMIRVETGHFTDLPTQTVWNRNLDDVSFSVREAESQLVVLTADAEFQFQGTKLSRVILSNGISVTNFKRGNLLGTARTLDMVNGSTKLDPGILSRSGVSVMDDSKSLLIGEEGQIIPRETCTDRYYFAYGHDYRGLLRDFFRLTGPVPLIPKFALGNWWSRYKAYTQEEYQELMREFIHRQIPITVATIDMDWHWTDVVHRFGNDAKPGKPRHYLERFYNHFLPGWTGYSWNTELFPDHRALLHWLHEKGFHVTLNVHPSQGIRFYEDCYRAACEKLGIDPDNKDLIPFQITDPQFMEVYFDLAHHPMEDEGVDFWWLDWQQGTVTDVPGLDPLWALNHYHTLDHARNGKRSLILSRYAGLGSHRYPLGFSGDTFCTWKSLDFQPYFTNTAANAGYTWWSHDIGGHQKGHQDDELYLRWLQYGVFSPIHRLHSSNSDFMGKEPWKRCWAVNKIASEFMCLRHKLIPYLYSANFETHTMGTPICMPMYYVYQQNEAYEAKNQFIFGGQLLVCPITKPMDRRLNLAHVRVWLPEGRWTDCFTGRIYRGGQWVSMYRDWDSIPVLAPAGAIVPMYQNSVSNDLSLDQPLDIFIWRGNGTYRLYDDDGETTNYRSGASVLTTFILEESGDSLELTIQPGCDPHGLLPEQRNIRICFRDIKYAQAYLNGASIAMDHNHSVAITLGRETVSIKLVHITATVNPPKNVMISDLLTRIQAGNDWKSRIFKSGKRFPGYIRQAITEFDALLYE